ncbi:MAG: DUF4965 domain-containing protein [Planctomycetaceae bacterium]|nr:DUF4965 domain-containing protein [Planctomycetaceae bacterium]
MTRLLSFACCFCVLFLTSGAAIWANDTPEQKLRAPAWPIITHDPYFSIWSFGDTLTDVPTTHWTGKPHPITGRVMIDHGKPLYFMGVVPPDNEPMKQLSIDLFPTRTVYTFADSRIQLTLTFITPSLPDDIDLLSRPLSYMICDVVSLDGETHDVVVQWTVSPLLAVNTPDQEVIQTTIDDAAGLRILQVGHQDQPILEKKGDDLRIDWGYFYLAAQNDLTSLSFEPRPEHTNKAEDAPLLTATTRFGEVGAQPLNSYLMLAYDDIKSIRYFGQDLPPYWKRNGLNATELIRQGVERYEDLVTRCRKFDDELIADLEKIGGRKYAELCTLVYRQVWAANKIIVAEDGQPYMLSKENFSNGCIGTVDLLYPHSPFLLFFSPQLLKGGLVPVLNYASSELWPYEYAPHDLGTYPHATGQVYGMGGGHGNRMPVEESGNMLIMIAALARLEDNAELAARYWDTITLWADYLVRDGFDPANQLCSADMFGHLAHVTNLSLKAIIGIGGYAQLCERLGKTEDAQKYRAVAEDYAKKWLELAQDDGRTRLAFDKPGTWSMKHNLIWDSILGTNLFPESLAAQEIAWYKTVQNRYGLPVDSRTDQSLIDWALWSITPARDPKDFETLFNPIYNYVHETPSRVPLSDWFFTTDAKQRGFQARSVVGGVYIKMLTDLPTWKKHAIRFAEATGNHTSLYPADMTVTEIVPTSRMTPTDWKYTLQQPVGDWFKPGFDDSRWQTGKSGFGGPDPVPGAPGVGTLWTTKDIWLRREFELSELPTQKPVLHVYYDESLEIWINGIPAALRNGYSTSYVTMDMFPESVASLKKGKNLIAVKASQTYGGQYIDAGLAVESRLTEQEAAERRKVRQKAATPTPAVMLFDYPLRDTSICRGPDGTWYLTGTTGYPTWWLTNEGIRVWKSSDLKHWESIGLVWSFENNQTWQQGRTYDDNRLRKAIWAPEIHYLKGTFWIAYCVNYRGTGLLKSTSGKAEGPYMDVKPDGPLTPEIDASLFQDDDGTVYFLFQDGKIAKMNDEMTALVEEPRLLKLENGRHVGFEGAFLLKKDGRYVLIASEFNNPQSDNTYDCMTAYSDTLEGPYTGYHLSIPSGGHNMIFQDDHGHWWSTFFGNDGIALFRERPGLVPIRWNDEGKIEVVR